MKKYVGIIYPDSVDLQTVKHITKNLEDVFSDHVIFNNYFLSEFNDTTQLKEDAFLAAEGVSFLSLTKHVIDLTKIINIQHCPSKSALDILKGMAAKPVLVITDSYESSLKTVSSLNKIGGFLISMIPYDRSLEHTGIYKYVTSAIIAGDNYSVPSHISEIIDIGQRMVSFDTMYSLMKVIDLDNDVINRNLFLYIQSVLEPNTSFYDNYISSYLKNEILSHITNKNKTAVMLVDIKGHVVYSNFRANFIFQTDDIHKIKIQNYIDSKALFTNKTFSSNLDIMGVNYQYNIYPFTLIDETVGYCLTLTDKSQCENLTKQNIERGYIAKYRFSDIVHNSPAMDCVIKKAKKIAPSDYTVLIRGESGTGKELIAQSIHNASYRNKAPFVAINCASLPENLLESELFGYDSGAFSGAKLKGKIGLFEQANHGTLFLDEIGDLSLSLQAKLLRAIQEKQIMRLGSDHLIDVDIRLITATNKNLESAVKSGDFRDDLFFRLNVLPIIMPPLRSRKEDIPYLMEFFAGSNYKSINSQELDILMNYDWPGNVRELENVAIYYKALSSLPEYINEKGESATHTKIINSQVDVEIALLEIIAKGTSFSHGIGRSSILHMLKSQSIDISDGKLRYFLQDLEEQGMVEILKGRSGTRITSLGAKRLVSAV